MDYIFTYWQPEFVQTLFAQIVQLLPAGFVLLGMAWLVGFVVHYLFRFMSKV